MNPTSLSKPQHVKIDTNWQAYNAARSLNANQFFVQALLGFAINLHFKEGFPLNGWLVLNASLARLVISIHICLYCQGIKRRVNCLLVNSCQYRFGNRVLTGHLTGTVVVLRSFRL